MVVLLVLSSAIASCGAAGTSAPEPVVLDPPSHGRYEHAMVWTGSELLVVGGHRGQDDRGAIVDDEPQRWTSADGFGPIPAPPGPTTSGPHSVWTGSEMIIWSGSTEPFGGSEGRVANAAAYEPTTMTWRELAPNSPLPLPHSSGKGVFVDGVVAPGRGCPAGRRRRGTGRAGWRWPGGHRIARRPPMTCAERPAGPARHRGPAGALAGDGGAGRRRRYGSGCRARW